MTDPQTIGIIAGIVAVVAIVLYVWDRRTKRESVDWVNAAKLALGAGGVAGGVAYAVDGDAIETAVEAGQAVVAQAQDMFVGRPTF
jgi:membrane-associated protease RseP (regulator of RpoE activity)